MDLAVLAVFVVLVVLVVLVDRIDWGGPPVDIVSIMRKLCFYIYLSNEAEASPGSYPYPHIVRAGGAYGTIARARSCLRSGDLGNASIFHEIE